MTPPRPPGRRLPARVYWFRRVMVLSLALGLVLGVAQLLGHTSDGDGQPVRAQTVGTAPSARTSLGALVPTADADPRPRSSNGDRRGKAKKTRTPLPQPSGPCADEDIVVTPEVVGAAHAGSEVTFRLNITTIRSAACTWQVSPRTVAVKLVSGTDRIWSSQDCPASIPAREVVARKEKAAVVDVTWRGQRSDSSCSRQTGWALPGWYHVQAAAFGAEPTDVQFELFDAVRLTITPEPKPERKGDQQDGRD